MTGPCAGLSLYRGRSGLGIAVLSRHGPRSLPADEARPACAVAATVAVAVPSRVGADATASKDAGKDRVEVAPSVRPRTKARDLAERNVTRLEIQVLRVLRAVYLLIVLPRARPTEDADAGRS